MKKISMLLMAIIVVTIFNPMGNVLAHNGFNEQNGAADIYSQWNLMLAGTMVVILAAFVYKFKTEEDFSKKFAFFFSALVVLYVTLGSPLHLLGDHYLFSAHMLEQSLVYTVFPPLLLLGLPKRFVAPIIHFGLRIKILSFLKYPLIPLLLFNVLFSFYHIPLIFNIVVANNLLHNLTHLILASTALAMWVPLIPVIKELDKLSEIQKIGYIFAAGILLTPACALIIFTNQPFYTVFSEAPQLFALLPPLEDQKTGGVIMKVVQEFVYGTMIGYIFFKWARKERLNDVDVLPSNPL
ncbi:cytochrome c oxidase assembly protein [Paenisporosarcina sp. TG20]|uniref:cytochrome c oxidase assembly protein n=1 Tax=Paenisporosarcina sp. TG20 TaxID=1211706 RepID=UPI0002FAA25B|nr:cytochrome c oxidase assembly protein [Paenisporosarcina sp. TG20]